MNRAPLYGCCDDGHPIDFSKAAWPNLLWYVYMDSDFMWTAFWIVIYPLYWILVSQWEYRYGYLRRFFGSSYTACGLLALTLLPISMYRDCRFMATVRRQPTWWLLRQNPVLWSGHALVVLGVVLVLCSFRLLGLWTTLLGDYFGIHENSADVRRRFPYTWFHHPMYWGASFIFLGIAFVTASQAGIVLALLAMFMYRVAIHFEHDDFCHYHHRGVTVEVGVETDAGSVEGVAGDNSPDTGEKVAAGTDSKGSPNQEGKPKGKGSQKGKGTPSGKEKPNEKGTREAEDMPSSSSAGPDGPPPGASPRQRTPKGKGQQGGGQAKTDSADSGKKDQ